VTSLVIAAGSRANDALWRSLRHRVKEVYTIGDCAAPRRLVTAMQEALTIALQV